MAFKTHYELEYLSQTFIKNFFHKGDEIPHCPHKILNAEFIETPSMTKGKYFETGLLGSSAKGDAVYDLPRRKLTKKEEGLLSKLFLKFLPHKSRFEANSGGSLFAEMVKRNIKNLMTTYIRVETSSSNKHTRILSRSGIILENFYFLEEDEYEPDSDYAKYIKNLTKYRNDGKSKHDDAPDSTAMMVDLVGIGSGKTTVESY